MTKKILCLFLVIEIGDNHQMQKGVVWLEYKGSSEK